MVEITDKFWTDDAQANERLRGCVIPVGNSYGVVQAVEDGEVLYEDLLNLKGTERKRLDDPAWSRFRVQAPTGWRNIISKSKREDNNSLTLSGGIYLKRRAVRTRSHGINRNNGVVYDFFSGRVPALNQSAHYNTVSAFGKSCIEDMRNRPSFRDAYPVLKDGVCVALSPKWAMYRDPDGLTWLYRKLKRVGIIIDSTSVSLFRQTSYLREEIIEEPILPLDIKEL